MQLDVPSINFSSMGRMEYRSKSEIYCATILLSMKQCVEPESTKASRGILESEILNEVSDNQNEFMSERVDALSLRISFAQFWVTHPSACVEEGGLHIIFLCLPWSWKLEQHKPKLCWQRKMI